MIKKADKGYVASKYPKGGVFKSLESKRRGHIAMWVVTVILAVCLFFPFKTGIVNLAYYKATGDSEMVSFGIMMLVIMLAVFLLFLALAVSWTIKNKQSKNDPLAKYMKRYPYYTKEQLMDFDRQICSGEGVVIRDDASTNIGDMIITNDWIKFNLDDMVHMDDICAAYYTPVYGGMNASHLVILDKRKKMHAMIIGKYEIDSAVSIIRRRNPYIFSDKTIMVAGHAAKLPKEADLVIQAYENRKRDAGV